MITLSIKKLKKSFGPKTIFSEVSFNHQLNTLGIAGSNGSGKSTFLKCLGNLLPPSNGSIQWIYKDTPISTKSVKQRLGYAAPYINLYSELSCIENLTFIAKIRHQTNIISAIDTWLSKVKLNSVAHQAYGTLSTGQQQRLRLASALFHDPDILLLDEPGSNLDASGRHLIQEIAEAYDTPEKLLIIASNNPDELELCDEIFSIEKEAFV